MEPLDDPRGLNGFHKHMHPYYIPPPRRCERCNELADLEWREAYWCRECFQNREPDIGYCTKCEKKIDRSDDWETIEGNLICSHCLEEGEVNLKGSIVKIVNEDCLKLMKRLGDSSIDAIVTDPPYEIGFNGNAWDSTGIAFSLELWREALRIVKPGGYLLAFSAARTYHRVACAVEDAGFEIRDQMMWLYGSGFPKGINIAKGIDKALGVPPTVIGERVLSTLEGCMFQGREKQFKTVDITVPTSEEAKKWDGWNSTLKPAHEPIVMGRKPFEGSLISNVLLQGTGGIHIDRCRIPGIGSEHPLGRWPANVVMDQEAQKKLEEQQQGASKFFYCAKPTRADKGQKNIHPTVKPTRLMEYLIQLVCPEGGTVFDPFLGSGTTAVAAIRSGVNFQGSELGKEYYKIAQERIEMEQKKQGRKEG